MKALRSLGLGLWLLAPFSALAQPTGFSGPETLDGWVIRHESDDSPWGECEAVSPGATQLVFSMPPYRQTAFLLANGSWNFRQDARSTVQFDIGDFRTNLTMDYASPQALGHLVPNERDDGSIELFRRTLLSLGSGLNVQITMPDGQRAQIPTATARVQDALTRCFNHARALAPMR